MFNWVDSVLSPASYQKFTSRRDWQPAVNICEDTEAYFVIVDLAGVVVSEIDLRVEEGDLLLLTGRRATPVPGQCSQTCMHVMEIDDGEFNRAIKLPANSDVDEINASYKCGYLTIRVPKKG